MADQQQGATPPPPYEYPGPYPAGTAPAAPPPEVQLSVSSLLVKCFNLKFMIIVVYMLIVDVANGQPV